MFYHAHTIPSHLLIKSQIIFSRRFGSNKNGVIPKKKLFLELLIQRRIPTKCLIKENTNLKWIYFTYYTGLIFIFYIREKSVYLYFYLTPSYKLKYLHYLLIRSFISPVDISIQRLLERVFSNKAAYRSHLLEILNCNSCNGCTIKYILFQ